MAGPVLVVLPMAEERAALVGALERAGYATKAATLGRLACVLVPDLGVVAAVGGHGKTQLAVQTAHLLEHQPAALVVCAGAAGALADGLAVGDVVVATCVVEHDMRYGFTPRPPPRHATDGPTVDALRALPAAAGFATHFGAIASGDEDVVDRVRGRRLGEETGALCVAWEGAGAARAARFHGVPFVELRAITDAADANASADFHANLAVAVPNLARVLVPFCARRWPARA